MSDSASSDKNLTLCIQTTSGEFKNDFEKTTKISVVISAVVSHFGFANDGKYQLSQDDAPDTALDPTRPLVSFGLKDNDVLVFTDLGVAV